MSRDAQLDTCMRSTRETDEVDVLAATPAEAADTRILPYATIVSVMAANWTDSGAASSCVFSPVLVNVPDALRAALAFVLEADCVDTAVALHDGDGTLRDMLSVGEQHDTVCDGVTASDTVAFSVDEFVRVHETVLVEDGTEE